MNHQIACSEQVENHIVRTLARHVAVSLTLLMESNDDNRYKISMMLAKLTQNSRILDTVLYSARRAFDARRGEEISAHNRLMLGGKRVDSYFNHQIVHFLSGKDGPLDFLRLMLDTNVLATDAKQVAYHEALP
ncbi:MAG: AhpA/YtjB family protein [Candidatus Malihini olakiniferum]